jgi:ubiquinone/menaquinone biosynthesis C-methylase UbiE
MLWLVIGAMIRTENREIREKYRAAAPRYDHAMLPLERLVLGRWRRLLAGQARGRVLEVASGTGANLPYYPPGLDLTLVDISPEMLEIAERRATGLRLEVRTFVMDAANLELPAAGFDTVVSTLGICTFPDPLSSLKEMSRVCRPSGRILLLEHGRSTSRLLSSIQDRYAAPWALRTGCHWNRDVAQLVVDAGMKLESVMTSWSGIICLVVAAPH